MGILSYCYTYSNALFQLHSSGSVIFQAFILVTKTLGKLQILSGSFLVEAGQGWGKWKWETGEGAGRHQLQLPFIPTPHKLPNPDSPPSSNGFTPLLPRKLEVAPYSEINLRVWEKIYSKKK